MKALAGKVSERGSHIAQFVIQRTCAVDPSDAKTKSKVETLLPMVIWVDLQQVPRIHPEHDCGGKRYVVPFEEAKIHRSKIGKTSDRDYSVCEHMGSLIE